MTISKDDQDRIASAIRVAEQKTSGEIVCVLAHRSTDTTTLPILIAAIVAICLPWLLVAFTTLPVQRLLALQAIAFVLLAGLLCLPAIRVALIPRAARRAAAHRAAMEQFHIRGIARTEDRCGVLIFVSLEERYVRVVADDGIAAQVPQSEWQQAVDAMVTHMRGGRIADGFIAAIDACGQPLAAHFPRKADTRDELSNRVYVI